MRAGLRHLVIRVITVFANILQLLRNMRGGRRLPHRLLHTVSCYPTEIKVVSWSYMHCCTRVYPANSVSSFCTSKSESPLSTLRLRSRHLYRYCLASRSPPRAMTQLFFSCAVSFLTIGMDISYLSRVVHVFLRMEREIHPYRTSYDHQLHQDTHCHPCRKTLHCRPGLSTQLPEPHGDTRGTCSQHRCGTGLLLVGTSLVLSTLESRSSV